MSLLIRTLSTEDLPLIMQIQAACYPAHFNEAAEVFAERIANYAHSSWLALRNNQALGYLFTYPTQLGQVCKLGSGFSTSQAANCLYLHDMAVLPEAKGQGIASALLSTALQYGRQRKLRHSALVAVQNSATFWQKFGYSISSLESEQQMNLLSYGDQAHYLHKIISDD